MITLDFETRSRVHIGKAGASVYARDPSTEILCLAYGKVTDNQRVGLWIPGDRPPGDLLNVIRDEAMIEAHNAGFERLIWYWICHKRYGWPDIPFESWRCSLAACSRLALPRGLHDAGGALGLDVRKDDEGHKVMMRLCKPKPLNQRADGNEYDNSPEKFAKLYAYCEQDVRAQMAISRAIGGLTESELRVWQLDQRINLRGLAIDREGIAAALRVVEESYNGSCDRIREITGGEIETPKQVAQILEFLKTETGQAPEDLRAPTVEEWLDRDDLHPITREILHIRRQASEASTAKLNAMLARCDDDGRVRGNLIYHGASTGRWAGTGIQIQNFPRGSLSPGEIETVHDLIHRSGARGVDMLLGPPLETISGALRSMVIAASGNRLLVCDFASIEARVLAWIAGQADLLRQFREGQDAYVAMAAKIYGIPEDEVTKDQRFFGKTAILGSGYGMGAKAFRLTCKALAGVEIDKRFAKRVILTYRQANERIKAFWGDISNAAMQTIETGMTQQVGKLELTRDPHWLRIRLPSGRQLHYRNPEIVEVVAPWSIGYRGDISGPEELTETLENEFDIDLGQRAGGCWIDCDVPIPAVAGLAKLEGVAWNLERKQRQTVRQIQYRGVISVSRKWGRVRTYGGKLTENVVQAIARDFLAEAMLRCERDGYPIVATVHDEIISEVEQGKGSLEEFEQIIRQVPTWGRGCPIAVEGFEAERYRK